MIWPTRQTIPKMTTIGYFVYELVSRVFREIVRLSDSDDDSSSGPKSRYHSHSLNGKTDQLKNFTTCATLASQVPFYKTDFGPPF